MPVLVGEGPDDRLAILPDGAPPHLQITVSAGLLRSRVPTEMDWHRRPYHFAALFT